MVILNIHLEKWNQFEYLLEGTEFDLPNKLLPIVVLFSLLLLLLLVGDLDNLKSKALESLPAELSFLNNKDDTGGFSWFSLNEGETEGSKSTGEGALPDESRVWSYLRLRELYNSWSLFLSLTFSEYFSWMVWNSLLVISCCSSLCCSFSAIDWYFCLVSFSLSE